ncbi:MAG: aminotransferase class V-fold PLP-dependent enzyme [Clostridiales bacterium]|nr:aminotransferase class V-fold PLP-dependent enzyme [Clostridiales bacterium]
MIYLDNAATTYPKPPEVIQAVTGVMEKIGGNPGRAGHKGALAGGRIMAYCRELAARYLGVQHPERIIFCLNCTDAINMALSGLLCRGDEVLVSHGEHNAVMRPLMGYQDRGEIRIKMLAPDAEGRINPDTVGGAVTPNTKLMVLCHASNVTGVIQPAREIAEACHKQGIPLLLDAAQTAGTEALSGISADLIAMPGHKGLLGPMGTGILYVRPGINLRPFRKGGTGSASESMRQPDMLPDRLESGTANLPGIAGLIQGIKFVLRHQGAIGEYEHYLGERMRQGLMNMAGVQVYGAPRVPKVAVVSFNIAGMDSGQAVDMLSDRRLALRSGLHCAPALHAWLNTLESGTIRASLGPYNTQQDVDGLLEAVWQISRG